MDFELTDDQATIQKAVAEIAGKFDDQYWMECDRDKRFPTEFYNVLASGGWLGITTPDEYGGHGFGITEASILIEEVAKSGGGMNAASAIHLSIFGMHPVIKHGSEELKRRTLPRIVDGSLHVCFGVTEPGAGLDTTRITTFAKREGDTYRVNGGKVWISKAQESEKVLLLTRTQKIEDVAKKTDGMTLFLTDHVALRPGPAVRARGQHRQVPVRRRGLRGRRPRPADPRRNGLLRGVPRRPLLSRSAPAEDRAPVPGDGAQLPRLARAGPASQLLMPALLDIAAHVRAGRRLVESGWCRGRPPRRCAARPDRRGSGPCGVCHWSASGPTPDRK